MNVFANRLLGKLGMIRTALRQVYHRYFDHIERIGGSPTTICREIVRRTWNGTFYETSLGHYDFFWMRDFGTVAGSLTRLGHGRRVRATLGWALQHFMAIDHVTTCIDRAGHTFNAPGRHSVDALPWLLHSLVVSQYRLNAAERDFLDRHLASYAATYFDAATGRLRHKRYTELRDAVLYDRSAYAYALVGRLAVAAGELGLTGFPFPAHRYSEILIKEYWTGDYFKADRVLDDFSAEGALMPFFLGVAGDEAMAARTFDYITSRGYDQPYPLRYSLEPGRVRYRFGMGRLMMPRYTTDTIWTWHATFYLHLLARYRRPEYDAQYRRFAELIERHGTYPELVEPDGSWYYAPLYRADTGMIWAALFLELEAPEAPARTQKLTDFHR